MTSTATRTYQVGDRVFHSTTGARATITRVADYGDIWIRPDGSSVPLTTRACFLTAIASDGAL